MNRYAAWTAGVMVCVCAGAARAQISVSKHNFTQYNWNTSGEICLPCHTPHGGNWQIGKLWNHQIASPTQQYNLYNSGTSHVTSTNVAFDNRTKMCLSCHDGTVAMDNFGGRTNGRTYMQPGGYYIGTDLRDDHPMGSEAVYDATGTDPSFHPQNADHQIVNGTTTLPLSPWTDPNDGTTKYVVGCMSCHNPHRTVGANRLLWVSNRRSQLCLTCHIK